MASTARPNQLDLPDLAKAGIRFASGDLPAPSRQREKAAASRDQTRQARTHDGTGDSYQFSKSNLRYVLQANCSCERNAGDEFATCGRKREEVLPRPAQGKYEAERRPELIERADVRSPISGSIKVENCLVKEKSGNRSGEIVQDAVRKGLDSSLPDCRGPQDLTAGKLHQRVIGIINVTENRSPALSGRLVIELYVVARPAGGCVEDDGCASGCGNEGEQNAA